MIDTDRQTNNTTNRIPQQHLFFFITFLDIYSRFLGRSQNKKDFQYMYKEAASCKIAAATNDLLLVSKKNYNGEML